MRQWTYSHSKTIISLIFGAIASFCAWMYISDATRRIEESQEVTRILRAKRYLKPGQAVTRKTVEWANIPQAYVEPTAILDPNDLENTDGKPLYKVRTGLQKGEQLTRSKLIDDRIFLGLAWILEPGQTAWTVLLPPERAVGGWLRPGDRVQMLATVPKQPGWPKTKTVLLLDDVPILAVQDKAWNPVPIAEEFEMAKSMASEPILVTIGLTPKEAAMASLAEERGSLQLILLSSLRTKGPGAISVSMDHLKRGK